MVFGQGLVQPPISRLLPQCMYTLKLIYDFEACTRSVCEVNISVHVNVHVTHWKTDSFSALCVCREGGGERAETINILCALKREAHVLCFPNSYQIYTFGALPQHTPTKHIPSKMNYFSSDFYRW